MPAITLHHGDCIEVQRTLADATVDAVVRQGSKSMPFHSTHM
jgi:predicted methyltransferase